jgi:hypothetical protein
MTLGVGTMQHMAPEELNPPDEGAAVEYDAGAKPLKRKRCRRQTAIVLRLTLLDSIPPSE